MYSGVTLSEGTNNAKSFRPTFTALEGFQTMIVQNRGISLHEIAPETSTHPSHFSRTCWLIRDKSEQIENSSSTKSFLMVRSVRSEDSSS